jgi:tRNA dimethylallyltransferase
MPFDLICILGPTASGKTSIAARLAAHINGEIISADSRQVYRGMDIGTGKDLLEFQKNKIKYHLIDIAEPSDEYNVFRFLKDFMAAYQTISSNDKIPILVGGTGLYLSAVLQSYSFPEVTEFKSEKLEKLTMAELKEMLTELNPKLHNATDLKSRDRITKAILVEQSRKNSGNRKINLSSLNIGIKLNREQTKKRITERLKSRLSNGMVEEVELLLQKGISHDKLSFFGLEYKFISNYIQGLLSYNDMFQKLNSAIHTFAKKQMTWFRKMEREGVEIAWFHPDEYNQLQDFVISKLSNG